MLDSFPLFFWSTQHWLSISLRNVCPIYQLFVICYCTKHLLSIWRIFDQDDNHPNGLRGVSKNSIIFFQGFQCVWIALGCSALGLGENPVCLPIILLAPWYVWPQQLYKLKEHLNKISLTALKTVSLLILATSQKPRKSLSTFKLSPEVLTQKDSCPLLLISLHSSAIIEKNIQSRIAASFSFNTWAPRMFKSPFCALW